MLKFACFILASILAFMPSACFAEHEAKPEPFSWGQINFYPAAIERGQAATTLSNIKFTGYGKSGVIGKVAILDNEIIIDDIDAGFYTAKRQIWRGVSGNYREALEYVMHEGPLGVNPAEMPKFSAQLYEAEGENLKDGQFDISVAHTRMRDCSFSGYSSLEADRVILREKGDILARIGKIWSGETFVPENFEENPEGAIVENLNLKEMDFPAFKIKLEKLHLDYRDKKLEFALGNLSAPGAVLELVDIPNAPEEIKGSISGSGELLDNICSASSIVEFPGLFSLVASFKGTKEIFPAQLDFIFANDGISDYMTAGQKSEVELFGKLIPEGDVAIQGLLSSPGKILLGSLEEKGEGFKFTYVLK